MASDMGIIKSEKRKKDGRSNRFTLPAAAAAIAAALVLVLYAALGFFPFGRSSVLLTDLYSQYAPLLYRFYDCVTGRVGLFAELRMAGGVNLYVDTIRAFLDPFNYILLFFGRERLYLALSILVLLYMAAAAYTACLALRRFSRAREGCVWRLRFAMASPDMRYTIIRFCTGCYFRCCFRCCRWLSGISCGEKIRGGADCSMRCFLRG